MTTKVDFDRLWDVVTRQSPWGAESLHGPDHWRRVERNGLHLAGQTGADFVVVRLFALFHDARRIGEGHDPGHGARGAAYAASLRGQVYRLDQGRFETLQTACAGHTEQRHHDDPTIGTCWDADRLDLPRVGILPDPWYMSTAAGRMMAERISAGRPASRRSR